MARELTMEESRKICSPDSLGFESTQSLEPAPSIIGQSRALQALQFGLGMLDSGFNIYAAGAPGTGKMTAITDFLERIAREKNTPPDWCYVHNFHDRYRPKAIKLEAGAGTQFQRDMKKFIEGIRGDMRGAFESEDFIKRRDALDRSFQERRDKLFSELNEMAQSSGFAIQQSPMGIALIPIREGKPLTEQEILALSPEEKDELNKRRDSIQGQIKEAMVQMRGWNREAKEETEKLAQEVVEFVLEGPVEELMNSYGGNSDIVEYLKEMQKDILENRELFISSPDEQEGNPFVALTRAQALRKYEVNVLVDNSQLEGAPVIKEMNPTFNNLTGRLEKEAQFGALTSDFTMIRPGTLHRANGGYLVIRIEDILRNVMSWYGLKRCLREQEITIEELAERFGLLSVKSITPEPIPLEIKVIIIGPPLYYHLLYLLDPEFHELFKVKADFDSRMELNAGNLRQYSSTLCAICSKEDVRQLDKTAVAKLIEHSSRLAEDQQKLSTKFAEIADIVREASYWAGMDGKQLTSSEHISRAIDQRSYRSNLIQERIQEMMQQGTLKIDVEGEVTGQMNGLSLVDVGDYVFGRPSRITATTATGREGVIDIEREAQLGGRIHSKAVMILSGFLAERYAINMPLSLSARLVFEQSYEQVEGDSASSAELYALLSGLADAPIKQGIAATGSVNQKGEVQAVAGLNQKVEGFYEVCKAVAINGKQGVIIPESNVHNLMLKEGVLEAMREGKFHVYCVSHIDEGMEILTGVKAGNKLDDGSFEEGSINDRVQKRMQQMAKVMRELTKEEEGRKASAKEREKS